MSHVDKGDIHAYLDGALGAYPEEEATRIRRHLDACSECAELLAEERRLRREASEILSATPAVPIDLAPFEELVARAREAETTSAKGRTSRVQALRWAAIIVVSLGVGWLARDLTTPALDLANRPMAEAVRASGGTVAGEARGNEPRAAAADREVNETPDPQVSLAAVSEDVAREPDFANAVAVERGRVAASAESELFKERVDDDIAAQPSSQPARVQADVPPSAPAVSRKLDAVLAGAQAPSAQQAQARALSRPLQRSERSLVVADERMREGLAGKVAAKIDAAEEQAPELRQAGTFRDRAVRAFSVNPPPTSFVIPGIPVRDVRLTVVSAGLGASVVVVHSLPDGRVVELQFVPLPTGDADESDALGSVRELLAASLPEGWSIAMREAPGGLATLRGPLDESELSDMLARALANR